MEFKTELLRSVQTAIDQKLKHYKADRTYKAVILKTTAKGYVILDETGCERTVTCCIPGLSLKAGQYVWVKEPLADIKHIHICGVL